MTNLDVHSDVGTRPKQTWVVAADPHGPHAPAVRDFLAKQGVGDARWFHPRDNADLDRALADRTADAVLFPDTESLLCGVFDGSFDLTAWTRRSVRVELLSPKVSSPNGSDASLDPAGLIVVQKAWQSWSAKQERRRTLAGIILSLLALVFGTLVIIAARLL